MGGDIPGNGEGVLKPPPPVSPEDMGEGGIIKAIGDGGIREDAGEGGIIEGAGEGATSDEAGEGTGIRCPGDPV